MNFKSLQILEYYCFLISCLCSDEFNLEIIVEYLVNELMTLLDFIKLKIEQTLSKKMLYERSFDTCCKILETLLSISETLYDKKEFTIQFLKTKKVDDLIGLFCKFPNDKKTHQVYRYKIMRLLCKFANKCQDKIDEFDSNKIFQV